MRLAWLLLAVTGPSTAEDYWEVTGDIDGVFDPTVIKAGDQIDDDQSRVVGFLV